MLWFSRTLSTRVQDRNGCGKHFFPRVFQSRNFEILSRTKWSCIKMLQKVGTFLVCRGGFAEGRDNKPRPPLLTYTSSDRMLGAMAENQKLGTYPVRALVQKPPERVLVDEERQNFVTALLFVFSVVTTMPAGSLGNKQCLYSNVGILLDITGLLSPWGMISWFM